MFDSLKNIFWNILNLKYFYIILLSSTLFLDLPSIWHANTFTSKKINNITIKYVTYEINSDEYTLKVSTSDTAEDLSSLLVGNNALTGINGVFFCPADYTRCKGKNYTINERFKNGEDLSVYTDTGERWVFSWNKDMKPFIFKTHDIETIPRTEIFEWLGNYPILLVNDINTLPYYEKKWLLDKKMTSSLPRHFICSNSEKTKIMFWRTSAISLPLLPAVLTKIWCSDALNLDAGASSQFIYNGKYLVKWRRNIIDGFTLSHNAINTQEIRSKVHIFEHYLSKRLEGKDNISALLLLEKYQKLFKKLRTEIYEKNSSDILSDSGENIGYEIEIKEISTLEEVYMLNLLEQKIQELQYKYRQL